MVKNLILVLGYIVVWAAMVHFNVEIGWAVWWSYWVGVLLSGIIEITIATRVNNERTR